MGTTLVLGTSGALKIVEPGASAWSLALGGVELAVAIGLLGALGHRLLPVICGAIFAVLLAASLGLAGDDCGCFGAMRADPAAKNATLGVGLIASLALALPRRVPARVPPVLAAGFAVCIVALLSSLHVDVRTVGGASGAGAGDAIAEAIVVRLSAAGHPSDLVVVVDPRCGRCHELLGRVEEVWRPSITVVAVRGDSDGAAEFPGYENIILMSDVTPRCVPWLIRTSDQSIEATCM